MKLAWFGVEEWLNPMDSLARINLGSSCVSALRMDELFDLTGEDLDAFLNEMRTMSLHYHHGDATGSPRIKAAVAGIYPKGNVKPEEVMITHGGTGANEEPAFFQSRHPAHDGKDGGIDQCRAGIAGHDENESAEPAQMKHQLGDGAELAQVISIPLLEMHQLLGQ